MPGEKRYEIIDGERHMVPSLNRRHQEIIRDNIPHSPVFAGLEIPLKEIFE